VEPPEEVLEIDTFGAGRYLYTGLGGSWEESENGLEVEREEENNVQISLVLQSYLHLGDNDRPHFVEVLVEEAIPLSRESIYDSGMAVGVIYPVARMTL
jgi:hypothetical protein